MTENDRVKLIRQEMNLTLEAFGKRLGVTKVAISNIEKRNRNVTEQMRKAICREFNVSYAWLSNGDGDMFINSDAVLKDKVDQIMEGSSELHKKILKSVLELDDEDLIYFEKWINNFLDK
jgi:transcriptional regulator with XRE-family HTH domain|uniref:Helix-turn-helix XRE-family like protein n=1 Tax=Siphoviridae sp. ctQtc11 TaxID=2825497 RepID=A0A8S5P2W5_9CAUD|nr:MAG TPA: Helix-turn-helix XRE-family like protein [Siphoviridae sp. ctQtc11]